MIKALLIGIVTSIALVLSILLFPKVKIKNVKISTYIIISLIGAFLMICFRAISIYQVKESILINRSVNPLKILILFFSMTIMSIYLDEAGFFKYLAYKSINIAKENQFVIFIVIYLLSSLLTVFTSNDIVILSFTPFLCYFAKHAKVSPLPYLVACFVGANTWSMMLIIGNPTNIYLATSYGIDFISYFKMMVLPTLSAGIVELIILILLFHKSLKMKIDVDNETYRIDDRLDLIIGLFHLFLCLIALSISSYLNVEMYLISLFSSLSLIISNLVLSIFKKSRPKNLFNSFKRLPYELIVFVLSMFVIVESLNINGVTHLIGEYLNGGYTVFKYGYSSFIMSDLINNIPMSVLYSNIPNINIGSIYASIIGSNIGAFLTPIGALAGIMFTSLLSNYNVEYKFKDFIKYGIIISIPTISISLLVLALEL